MTWSTESKACLKSMNKSPACLYCDLSYFRVFMSSIVSVVCMWHSPYLMNPSYVGCICISMWFYAYDKRCVSMTFYVMQVHAMSLS